MHRNYFNRKLPTRVPDDLDPVSLREPMTDTQAQKNEIPIAQVIGIGMLLWALVPANPYGYYILLRIVICGIFVYLAVRAFDLRKFGWVWALAITAAIYNPIIRVHLTREIWSVVNIATIVVLAATILVLRKKGTKDI